MRKIFMIAALLMFGPANAHAEGNPVRGADQYKEECADCHSVVPGKNKKGPSLHGVVGRTPARVEGFEYSDPMKANATPWTPERLDAYITAPKKVVPHGIMKFDGMENAADRADVIAYLRTLGGS
ncbi:MAG: c-type cytochrome [Magnetococcales bacterium]|nr:c-type cytochrome [Magnetococcales bacterium]